MTGNADFADSFVSSEWYYNIPEIHDVWARYKKLSLERIKENKIQSEENQLENKE